MRAGASRDGDLRRWKDIAVHGEPARVVELGAALDVVDILVPGQNVRVFRHAQLLHQRVLLRHRRGPAGNAGLGLDAVEPVRSARMVQALHRADQRFGGHAAHVDACAADGPVADQGDPRPGFCGGDGSREAGRPGADHGEVVGAALGGAAIFHGSLSQLVRWRRQSA